MAAEAEAEAEAARVKVMEAQEAPEPKKIDEKLGYKKRFDQTGENRAKEKQREQGQSPGACDFRCHPMLPCAHSLLVCNHSACSITSWSFAGMGAMSKEKRRHGGSSGNYDS